MQKKPKRKRKDFRYMQRRLVLIFIFIAVLGFGIFKVVPLFSGGEKTMETPSPLDGTTPLQIGDDPIGDPNEPEQGVVVDAPMAQITDTSSEEWKLALVGPQHPLPADYEISGLAVATGMVRLDARVIDDLKDMLLAARAQGIGLALWDGYREADAVYYSTADVLPESDEHRTGLAVDFTLNEGEAPTAGFVQGAEFSWLVRNAHEYGFILRYPESKESLTLVDFEPWHFRYVGRENASVIYEKGYCLEEYLFSRFRNINPADMDEPDSDEG